MSTFPILKDEEILMCLAEMGIEIGKNDLHTPNSDVVRGVYERIIDGLMGVTREEMQAVPHDVVEDLAFPELHDESAAAMSFFKHLRKLFSASGVKDFSLKDVFQPEAKRLKRHLSGVINFIKYREEKVIVYVECHEQLEQTQAQREQLMDENSRLSAELQMLIAEEAREKPEVEGIQKEVEQLRGREVLLEQQYESLTVKGNKLKASYQAGRDQLKQLKLEQAAAVQKRNRLADRIVERPDKLLAELKELESRTNAERQAVKESQQLAHSTKDRIDVVERVRKEVAKLKEGMEDVQLAVEAKKEASRSVKQLSRAIADVERQLSEAQQVQLALRTRRTCNLEKISRIEAQKSSKSDAVRSKVEEQKRSKVAVEAQNAATAARMAENKAQMKQLKEQMEALEEGHTQLQQSTMQLYNRLRTMVTQFHASLFGALGEDPALPEAMLDMQVMPGAVELCGMLDRAGLPRGLITRNVSRSVRHFHSEHFPLPPFSPALSREFTPYKPSPAALLHICHTWSIRPEECVMIGDSARDDIACGNRAGAYTVLIDNGHYTEQERSAWTEDMQPHHTASSLQQVQELLSACQLCPPGADADAPPEGENTALP